MSHYSDPHSLFCTVLHSVVVRQLLLDRTPVTPGVKPTDPCPPCLTLFYIFFVCRFLTFFCLPVRFARLSFAHTLVAHLLFETHASVCFRNHCLCQTSRFHMYSSAPCCSRSCAETYVAGASTHPALSSGPATRPFDLCLSMRLVGFNSSFRCGPYSACAGRLGYSVVCTSHGDNMYSRWLSLQSVDCHRERERERARE